MADEGTSQGHAWGEEQTRFFFELTPDRVLEAVESAGFQCTGRCVSLNSFENRVYDVELETDDGRPPATPSENHRVVKFYRPGRWNYEQLQEEHQFILDLKDAEVPAIAPMEFPEGGTLRQTAAGIWYAVFPKVGGRAPSDLQGELGTDRLRWLGRLLGRIHAVGAQREAEHRVRLSPSTYGRANLEYLLQGNWIPLEFQARYQSAVEQICLKVDPWFESTSRHRIHGDCHLGNLLWNDQGPFFLDFDDMVIGPAVQDLWLLLPGRPFGDSSPETQTCRSLLETLLEGYEEMRSFDRLSLRLIEPLRALRFVHYSAWIARRWEDPAFPRAFPHFGTHRYWSDSTDDLEEQLWRTS